MMVHCIKGLCGNANRTCLLLSISKQVLLLLLTVINRDIIERG